MNEIFIYAMILLVTKLVSELFMRLGLPSVIGIIITGILAGPVFHIIEMNHVLEFLADVGILFLLFTAGLETDISHLKMQGKSSILAAIAGVFFPFAMAFVFLLVGYPFKETYIIGLILTATSVSITVITLIELKKLNTRSGITVLGAAVIDDIIAILLLSFSMIFLMHTGNLVFTIVRLLIFIIFIIVYYLFLTRPLLRFFARFKTSDPVISIAVIFMFLFACFAESMGIAAITGAYIAGLAVTKTRFRRKIMEKVSVITNTLFVAIFFFVIGLKTSLHPHEINIQFMLIFIFIAIFGKVFGSTFACYFSGMNFNESIKVGFGMVPRGEVALVIANVGLSSALINQHIFNSVVAMILITSFITPLVLKHLYHGSSIN